METPEFVIRELKIFVLQEGWLKNCSNCVFYEVGIRSTQICVPANACRLGFWQPTKLKKHLNYVTR
jgi:hypothetical protein